MNRFKRLYLHEQVAEALCKDLSQLPAGGRLQSDEILAKRYSVSISVMRRALRVLARNGSIVRNKGVGTFVSEELLRQQARQSPIGITLDRDPTGMNSSFFHRRLAERLRVTMSAKGFRTNLYIGEPAPSSVPMPQTSKDFMEDLRGGRLSGVFSTSTSFVFGEWAEIAEKNNLPVVGTYGEYTYSVRINTKLMHEEVARMLALQGRRRIGLIQWALPWSDPKGEPDEKIFNRTLVQYGVEPREKWIVRQPFLDHQAGWRAFVTLWNAYPEKPNGVFVADDTLFPGVTAAIMEVGVNVPEDLFVVTHANKGSGMIYSFPLMTVVYDPDECAELMAGMMVKLMRKEGVVPPHIQLPFRLVSVDKLPANA